LTLLADPNSDDRSLMNRAPCICDGEKTGVPCQSFWAVTQKFDAANADALRSGVKNRQCTLMHGWLLEFVSEEKPTFCNRYSPRPAPGLLALVQRAIGNALGMTPNQNAHFRTSTPGFMRFDDEFNRFHPMTLAEIDRLREEFPDRPVTWGVGKDPSKMSVGDIMNSDPIGILKPGETMPGSLSSETSAFVDGIFDAGFLNKKDT
jgi:hypothetical protein